MTRKRDKKKKRVVIKIFHNASIFICSVYYFGGFFFFFEVYIFGRKGQLGDKERGLEGIGTTLSAKI